MRKQLDLLRDEQWRVLLILDAARPDVLRATRPTLEFETLESPAYCTREWVDAAFPVLKELGRVLYLSANPAVGESLGGPEPVSAGTIAVIPLWRNLWGWHTAWHIPTVHPHVFAGAALMVSRTLSGCYDRLVIHFMQPHAPFIGEPPLDTTRWNAVKPESGFPCLNERGDVPLENLKAAYQGNMDLVIDAAENLVDGLCSEAVLTADHAELLGEDGLQGHMNDHPVLHEVPWARLKPRERQVTIRQKLEALGYL